MAACTIIRHDAIGRQPSRISFKSRFPYKAIQLQSIERHENAFTRLGLVEQGLGFLSIIDAPLMSKDIIQDNLSVGNKLGAIGLYFLRKCPMTN